jgi:hypothetical protein
MVVIWSTNCRGRSFIGSFAVVEASPTAADKGTGPELMMDEEQYQEREVAQR